jgi:hypothetical protein
VAFRDDPLDVIWEYHLAAYAGQKIADCAKSFAYYVPSVYRREPYRFEVHINKLDPFASILFDIIIAFHHYGSDEQINSFQLSASEFFIKAYAQKKEPATWGMLSIVNQFLCNNFPYK